MRNRFGEIAHAGAGFRLRGGLARAGQRCHFPLFALSLGHPGGAEAPRKLKLALRIPRTVSHPGGSGECRFTVGENIL